MYLYEPSNKYIRYVGVIKDGAELPGNIQHSNGVINIYFHEVELVALLATLHNERTVFVKYKTDNSTRCAKPPCFRRLHERA